MITSDCVFLPTFFLQRKLGLASVITNIHWALCLVPSALHVSTPSVLRALWKSFWYVISQVEELTPRERLRSPIPPSYIKWWMWDTNENRLVPMAASLSFRVISGSQPCLHVGITGRPWNTDVGILPRRDSDVICLHYGQAMEVLKAPQVALRWKPRSRAPDWLKQVQEVKCS